jgi:RNA-directed DNA polymerase
MQESYGADRASHTDPESWAVARKDGREALIGAWAGGLWSREILIVRGADAVPASGRQHLRPHHGKRSGDLARSKNPGMHRNTSRENREVPCLPVRDGATGRGGKSKDRSQRCTNTGSLTGV